MAELFANRVIDGKTLLEEVPNKLKDSVNQILKDKGYLSQ